MATIGELLNKIKTAVYGKEVRQAIHDSIKKAYDDASKNGNANMEVSLARGEYDTLGERITANESSLAEKATNTALGTERARINNIVANVGNTSGNTEIVDLRVGEDGVTYSSAGDALRKQVGLIKGELDKVKGGVYEIGTKIGADSTSSGWKLLGNGLCASDASYSLKKYLVTADTVIYLKIAGNGVCTYQFQNSATVPSSSPNSYLIGNPNILEVDSFVKVPAGATHLIVSVLNTDTISYAANSIGIIPNLKNNVSALQLNDDTIKGGLNKSFKELAKLYYKRSISENIAYDEDFGYVIRDGYAQKGSYTYMKCKSLDVEEYSTYYITTVVNNGFSSIILVDENMKVIASYEAYQAITTIRDYPVMIPKGTKKLLLNCNKTQGATVYENKYSNDTSVFNANGIRSINRLGYRVNGGSENTMYAFKEAIKYGYNILLCDVQFTSDNVPVSIHDTTLNRTARNLDGTELTNTVNIANITYQNTFNYDFGINGGKSEIGIITVEQVIKLCKFAGCELYLEYKAGSFEQWDEVMKMVARYGMIEKTSLCSGFNLLQRYTAMYPKLNLGLTNRLSVANLEQLATVVSDKHRTFLFGWSGDAMTDSVVDDLILKGIEYEFGTIDNELELPPYILGTHKYASGLLTNNLIASDVMRKYALNN